MPIAARSGLWIPPRGLPSRQRKNRSLRRYAPDGRKYETCPMCSAVASLRSQQGGETVWECQACGYRDGSKSGPLN